jgi:hypothetical protein
MELGERGPGNLLIVMECQDVTVELAPHEEVRTPWRKPCRPMKTPMWRSSSWGCPDAPGHPRGKIPMKKKETTPKGSQNTLSGTPSGCILMPLAFRWYRPFGLNHRLMAASPTGSGRGQKRDKKFRRFCHFLDDLPLACRYRPSPLAFSL